MTPSLAVAIVVDVTVALAAGLLIVRALRRRPAALRHWVLAASLVAAAGAPLLEIMLPRLELPILRSSTASAATSGPTFSDVSPAAAPVVTQVHETNQPGWVPMVFAVWALGCAALLISLLAGLARLTWMTRQCRPVRSHLWRERAAALSIQYGRRRPAVVVESPDRALLLTWGLIRPRIIVPATAASWSADRIDVVLAHELAHIVRCDWAVQVAAEALRAVHWFNPLMWIACRQLRVESEHACDDAVLRRGVEAADYASHLLAVARHVATAGGGWASAPAVAHMSTLERRIAAMLNVSSNREQVSRTARLVAALVMVAITVPVAASTLTEKVVESPFVPGAGQDVALEAAMPSAAGPPMVATPVARRASPPAPAAAAASAQEMVRMRVVMEGNGVVRPVPAEQQPAAAPAQQTPASLSGTIRDAQGGVMPGVLVALTDASGTRTSTTTDSNGQFRLRPVVPGEYQFTASLPGFRTHTSTLNLAEGQELRSDLLLPIGQIAETIVVTCAPAGAALLRGAVDPPRAVARRSTVPRLFPPLRGAGDVPALAAQVVPVRIGGNVKAPQQIRKVPPRCPSVTPGAGLVVILEATIGVDGLIRDLKVLRPTPADDKQVGYVQAAVDAVRQWEYTPTLLNNVPTAVIMTVTVTFTVPASAN